MNRISIASCLCGVVLSAAGLLPSVAQAAAGRVLYTAGEVFVLRDGEQNKLVRGASVAEGDKIETGNSGRAHIRMADRTLLSLRPSTEFTIEEYDFRPPAVERPTTTKAQQIAAAQEAEGRSFYGLVKGGFRAITGLIGKRDQSSFGVRTPVATIGIRGTTLDVVCISACDGGAAFASWDGTIVASNSGGSVKMVAGETGFAPDAFTQPRLETEPRPELLDDQVAPLEDEQEGDAEMEGVGGLVVRRAGGGDGGDGGGQGGGTTAPEEDPVIDEPAGPMRGKDIAYATGPFGSAEQGDALEIGSRPDFMTVNSDGELEAFVGVYPSTINETGLAAAVFSSSAENPVSIANVGFDRVTGNRWGRYAGGRLQADLEDGSRVFIDLAAQSFHWIIGPTYRGDLAIPRTGTRQLTVFGNTDPTNNLGDVGVLGDATLFADFGALRIDSTLALSINDRVWTASGSGDLGAALSSSARANAFAGDYSAVSAGGQAGAGRFAGFLNPGANGAGLSYVLSESAAGGTVAEIVSGVATFRSLEQ